MTKRVLIGVVSAVFLSLFLAGCGGDKGKFVGKWKLESSDTTVPPFAESFELSKQGGVQLSVVKRDVGEWGKIETVDGGNWEIVKKGYIRIGSMESGYRFRPGGILILVGGQGGGAHTYKKVK